MPPINKYKCNVCEFEMPMGWGGNIYVINDNGERIFCPHPGEASVVAQVLNIDENTIFGFPWLLISDNAPINLLKERVGFNSDCVCLDCLCQFEQDINRDGRQCLKCGSKKVKTESEIIGEPCPKCKKGMVEMIETGIMS